MRPWGVYYTGRTLKEISDLLRGTGIALSTIHAGFIFRMIIRKTESWSRRDFEEIFIKEAKYKKSIFSLQNLSLHS